MKKVRLKDIAEQAGVSVATVSYVLSNKTTQKISEETKLKIYQVASFLNYKKDFVADLMNGKTNHVGLYLGDYHFPIYKSELLRFIQRITLALQLKGLALSIISSGDTKTKDNIDAIICLGVTDTEFFNIATNNIIPVIAVDSTKHVPWSFQFSHVYQNIKDKFCLTDYTLLAFKPNSSQLEQAILKNNKNVIFVENYLQINNLKNKLTTKNVVVGGDDLFEYLQGNDLTIYKYPLFPERMINEIADAVILAIESAQVEKHDFLY